MFAKLQALVASGPAFNYNLGQQHDAAWGSWTHFSATAKDSGAAVSVFKVSARDKTDPQLVAARNGVRRLRTLRHPNILSFKDTLELEEKGMTVIYVVTEAVTPLADRLHQLDMSGPARDEYIAMGLYHVAKAVSFLNNDCKLLHGNVCMAAVVVTETLDWRLHGFDLVSEHSGSAAELPLMAASWMVQPQYKPSEVAKSEWAAVQQGPPWAVDAWGMGCLIQEAFSGQEMTKMEQLRNLEPIPKAVVQDYQRLLSTQPPRRLNTAKLAESSALKNKLVELLVFMENLAVKDSSEKDLFFKRLPQSLPSLPLPVAQYKLLPLLSQALEFGGAPAVALGSILQIGAKLDEAEFTKRVVPCISKLFASNDRTIRRSLLESIDSYGKFLTQGVVEDQVYPHVTTGFSDSNAYLRELTLKSMLVLAPKLTQRTLNQSLLKFLAKLQVDEEPPIRANTTILLGNLAPHLSEAACKRVLLNAFTRALKDSFPPARVAGLKAMVATVEAYAADEAAQRIIPAVAPLGVDPVPEVRQSALAALDAFMRLLKEHSTQLETAATATGSAAGDTAQGSAAGGWSVGLTSNLGWALSGFGGKAKESATGEMAASSGAPAPPPPSSTSAPAFASPPGGTAAATAPAASTEAWTGGEAATDGWNEDDDDLMQEDAEEAAARQRLSRLTTRQGPGSAGASRAPAASQRQGGHLKPPALSANDGWAADLDDGGDKWQDMDAQSPGSVQSDANSTGSASGRRGAGGRGPRGASMARRGGRRGVTRTGAAGRGMKLGATKTEKPLTEETFEF